MNKTTEYQQALERLARMERKYEQALLRAKTVVSEAKVERDQAYTRFRAIELEAGR